MAAPLSLEYAAIVVSVLHRMLTLIINSFRILKYHKILILFFNGQQCCFFIKYCRVSLNV